MSSTPLRTPQWWLASIDQHGNPTLVDGSHSTREGAERAAYLIAAMKLGPGKRYAVARVELAEPQPSSKGVNHAAVAEINRTRR